jgi:hypothetical protein
VRVPLSEASSLTARQHLSVLGPTGIDIDVASGSRLAIGRFSRWCHHVVRVPRSADDPKGYLTADGPAYAAWTGIGAAGTAAIGMLVLGDKVTAVTLASIALILLGVIGLNLSGVTPP